MSKPKFPRVCLKAAIYWLNKKINPSSLQTRLTVGIAIVSAAGLGTVAIWTSWKMQQILIVSHKHNIEQIAERFPRDVEMYSETGYLHQGLQKAIDNLALSSLFLWVKSPEGMMLGQSDNLEGDSDRFILMSTIEMPLKPTVFPINGRYFVLCRGPLQVKGTAIGQLYTALDITRDQQMLVTMVLSLSVASFLAIIGMTLAIALYIKRSLAPIRHLSQLADTVSADHLHQTTMHLHRAPEEVKELAKTLDTMLGRLSDSWEMQRQFVSNVSHELRTPLTIVSGYLQSTLRRGTNLTPAQQEALQIAMGEAQRTIGLLQDLLELARADSGQIHFDVERVVLNDLIAEVVEMAKQFSDREIIFKLGIDRTPINSKLNPQFDRIFSEFNQEATANANFSIAENLANNEEIAANFSVDTTNINSRQIQVLADSNRLKQVFLNLIDNAVKYSDAGLPVTVCLKTVKQQAIVEVYDKGNGIPLSQQARIFERFYRVDETRNRATGGAGLGLSIVQSLLEGMGGSISVRSKLNEGSVFVVALPLLSSG